MSSAEIESPIPPFNGEPTSPSAGERATKAGREAASNAKRQIKQQAESLYEEASSTAASTATDASDVIDDAADALDKSGHEKLARAAAALSDRIRNLSAYLESRSFHDVLRGAQRNPALMIGAGVALGVVLTHFLKAGGQSGGK